VCFQIASKSSKKGKLQYPGFLEAYTPFIPHTRFKKNGSVGIPVSKQTAMPLLAADLPRAREYPVVLFLKPIKFRWRWVAGDVSSELRLSRGGKWLKITN
jgi:hypothetical protein